jgi:hypothetical protein
MSIAAETNDLLREIRELRAVRERRLRDDLAGIDRDYDRQVGNRADLGGSANARFRIRPVAGSPRFGLSSLLQIIAWSCLGFFFMHSIGWMAIIVVPGLVILIGLLMYERSTSFITGFAVAVWGLFLFWVFAKVVAGS